MRRLSLANPFRSAFRRRIPWVLPLVVSACAPLLPGEMTAARIETAQLGFLEIGATTAPMVAERLGRPTFSAANNTVWAYRMTLYTGARHTPDSYGWNPDLYRRAAIPNLRVQTDIDTPLINDMAAPVYELVLVFDASGKLRRYRVFRPYPSGGGI